MHSGDMMIAASVILSESNCQKISMFAKYLKLPKSTFFKIQRHYVIPSVDEYWIDHQDAIQYSFREQDLMTFFCFQCGTQYNLMRQLTRHVRDKHSKKMLQCRFCWYLVPTSKRFRLMEHEKNVHRHIMNPRTKDRELIIPETPTRTPVPTS
ncbi:Hypothetical predicted protein [Mytilus galloprovincialis]|uniref:C2H2-type domain-containing protein n=1 Tax=Mytilus galloprovincialis TaxID=29158 RepID=A0A8B6DR17_MYTGA|nr:Hypothetical predicted protein [Mytilus galloprovincialis]